MFIALHDALDERMGPDALLAQHARALRCFPGEVWRPPTELLAAVGDPSGTRCVRATGARTSWTLAHFVFSPFLAWRLKPRRRQSCKHVLPSGPDALSELASFVASDRGWCERPRSLDGARPRLALTLRKQRG